MFWRRKKEEPTAHTPSSAPSAHERVTRPASEPAPSSEENEEFYFDADFDEISPAATEPPAEAPAPEPKPLPASNLDWPLEALRGLPLNPNIVAQTLTPMWTQRGTPLQERGALRLVRRIILRIPLVLREGQQELWVFPYERSDEQAAAHFLAVERKANLFGAVAVYLAPAPLELGGVTPLELSSDPDLKLERWPEDAPFPEGEYALWWPSSADERLSLSEEGRLLSRVFTLQDEAASLLYGLLTRQLHWNEAEASDMLRRELPEKTSYLRVMADGEPLLLSAAQDKGVRLHLRRDARNEGLRREWLERAEHLLRELVRALLGSGQPLDTLWHDYETRPSQWWHAAQQVLDLSLDIGEDPRSLQIGSVTQEFSQGEEA